jgi:hypothetical protein
VLRLNDRPGEAWPCLTLLIAGVAMLVLPGPGILVIALALAVLRGEFIWARRLLERMKQGARRARDAIDKSPRAGC